MSRWPAIKAILCASCVASGGLFLPLRVTVASPLTSNPAGMTGPQVMARCRQAYERLRSYQATITVRLKPQPSHPALNLPPGFPNPMTLAHLQYLRPGKINVSGYTYLKPSKRIYFRLLCKNRCTWTALDERPGGKLELWKKQGMGIGFLTGVSEAAAASLPGVFLHSRWGCPEGLKHPQSMEAAVVTATVAGRPCYGVQKSRRYLISERYWIDRKTFLLVQIEDNLSRQTFQETHLNPEINPQMFRRKRAQLNRPG